MIIGGLQKTSVIDFPQRVACVVFTAGCNFRCPYCHNPELIKFSRQPAVTLAQFWKFLEERRHFLDGVVITGGEPTGQPDLADFCRHLKTLGLDLKLDTNGSHPDRIEALLQKDLVDYWAMDVKTMPAAYPRQIAPRTAPENIRRSIDLLKNAGIPGEFRTTCARPLVDPDIVAEIADLIAGAPLYVLQRFRPERVLDPAFFRDQPPVTEAELEDWCRHAEKKVDQCLIR